MNCHALRLSYRENAGFWRKIRCPCRISQEKTPNDELIARGSVKTKTFRREDSTSWVARNPVNAMKRISFISMEKIPIYLFHPEKFILEGMEYRCSE